MMMRGMSEPIDWSRPAGFRPGLVPAGLWDDLAIYQQAGRLSRSMHRGIYSYDKSLAATDTPPAPLQGTV